MDEGRQRLLIAGGTFAALAALIVVVLLVSGEEDREFEPAPSACVEDWNGDGAALTLGQHQFSIHRYQRLEIGYMTTEGAPAAASAPGAVCSVVFSAAVLDAEPSSTVQILREIGWSPLAGAGVPRDELADLQTSAQESYNALLQPDGSIEPL